MRFIGLIAVYGAATIAGCDGGRASADAPTDAVAALTSVAAADRTGPLSHTPITGKVHEVKMRGDGTGYRFEPRTIRARPGDGIKFIMHSLGPHNIVFDSAAVPADQRGQLFANMPNSQAGISPMLLAEAEVWELSLGGLKPGRYPFFCSPHLGANMSGEIIIQ